MKQSRRTFLRLAAGTTAGLATGVDFAFARDWVRGDDPLAALTGIASGSDDFAAIGKAYRKRNADEADAAVLLRVLGFRGGDRDPTTREELLAVVHAGILRDVANDDLVQLQGWLLSRTECRLFLLGSLEAG